MLRFRRKKQSNRKPDLMVVGLGNPGGEYDRTRHNVGFEVLDRLAKVHRLKLSTFKHSARYVTWEHADKAVLLVKPMSFMNLSGQPVSALARHYGLRPESILVVADDLDLPVGQVKMKPKGGSGGHKGHKSIAQALGTDEYPRIKIGIDKVAPSERGAIDTAVEKSWKTCELFVEEGLDAAMNSCNSD